MSCKKNSQLSLGAAPGYPHAAQMPTHPASPPDSTDHTLGKAGVSRTSRTSVIPPMLSYATFHRTEDKHFSAGYC